MFGVVTLFYTKIHNEFFIFLGVALHYTIHHIIKLWSAPKSFNDFQEHSCYMLKLQKLIKI